MYSYIVHIDRSVHCLLTFTSIISLLPGMVNLKKKSFSPEEIKEALKKFKKKDDDVKVIFTTVSFLRHFLFSIIFSHDTA